MLNKQIIGHDGTTPITLYGYNQALNKWGFFVTKAGVDVTTNTDLSQFIFNSSQDVFKIVLSGTTSLAVPDPFTSGSTLTATIPHGLSITPAFMAFVSIPAGSGVIGSGVLTSLPAITAGSGSITTLTEGATDSTNLYLYIKNTFGASLSGAPFGMTWTFRYYILQETAT